MLFFLLTGISFFFFFLNSLSLKPLPPWANDVRLLPLCFWKVFSFSPICKALKQGIFGSFCRFPSIMAIKQGTYCSKFENLQGSVQLSILDLPELALDCILEKLHPSELCRMAVVCSSLRERCISDHLWERHMNRKWGKVIGLAARREWQWFVACRRNSSSTARKKSQSLVKFICNVWPFSWFTSKFDKASNNNHKDSASPLVDSVMSWYLALESGKFWFPAQVYNRENGHVGFVLSCYDAELSYDSQSDTFQASYPPHGRRAVAIESGIQWERLRAAPVDTPPHDLHASDCLNDLHPGDHIEIQWRRNKEFPYGWWYGVVSHLESCDGNENYCRCHSSDTVLLEFSQYTLGSRWRKTIVSRKDHREEGNESDGFYGGIRKLYKCDEIATWKNMWPKEILD